MSHEFKAEQPLSEKDKMDFFAIGDITADTFITINDVRIDIDNDADDRGLKEICFRFGDKIPYERIDMFYGVGNSPNATVSAAQLGLNTGLYTVLGDDEIGNKTIQYLRDKGLSTEYIVKEQEKKSNHHYVLRNGNERTILVKHEHYTYNFPHITSTPRWIYLSSLGEQSISFHNTIIEYVITSGSKLAFQPGTFQIKLGKEKLANIYKNTEVFFCNKEEAERILDISPTDVPTLMKYIHALGPRIVSITDGSNGAYASDGTSQWFIPVYPNLEPVIDRTGAGDAFSSTFTSALALGFDVPTALSWGPINSMSVVQHIGPQAGLLSRERIEELFRNAPENYKVKKINS